MKYMALTIILAGCSDKSSSVSGETGPSSQTETAEPSLPTRSEIEEAIHDANYCETSDDCGFVHSCWCGAVANVSEITGLQELISEWMQDPDIAKDCASSDCAAFSDIVCEESICIAVEDD